MIDLISIKKYFKVNFEKYITLNLYIMYIIVEQVVYIKKIYNYFKFTFNET